MLKAGDISSSGPLDARIMLVCDYPHALDFRGGLLSGGPGFEFTKILAEAGISLGQCYVTCVYRQPCAAGMDALVAKAKNAITDHQPFGPKWVKPDVIEGINHLRWEIEQIRPNVVVTLGNLALLALTWQWGQTDWRSSIIESLIVPGQKVVPTLSPMLVMQQWSYRPIVLHDLRRAKVQSEFPEIRRKPQNFLVRPSWMQATATLSALLDMPEGTELGMDIETRAGHTACIAIAWTESDAICIPFMCVTDPEGYWTLAQEAYLVWLLYRICRKHHIIGQNWNYDEQYFYRWWHFTCPRVTDTMIQQHSCFSNLEKNLAFLSSMYLDDHYYWKDDRTAWEPGKAGEGEDVFWNYNCTDAARTLAIKRVLDKVVGGMGLQPVNDFQQHLRTMVLRTMNRGVRVDTGLRSQLHLEIEREIADREAWLERVIGHPLNIRSPKQMQDFFYQELAQRPVKAKKTGNDTTNDEALRKLAEREPMLIPLTRKIAELRSLGVFLGTFVKAPLDTDGRMRTSFNLCGTDTYRFSSTKNAFGSGMNLQNIPKGGETDDEGLNLPNVRRMFVPDPGHTFFDTDLDSADLRIVTWESNCQWMKEQFANGRKPYVEIMKEYYHDQSITKSHKDYGKFKSLCHGTNYLGTAAGIAPRIGLNVAETERIQKWYYGLCPEIKAWQEELKAQVSKRRWIQNAFGYRIHFFDRIEGNVFNQAVAWIPQSTVACLINRIYANVHADKSKLVEVLLQVHDSLAGQFETGKAGEAMRVLDSASQVNIPYAHGNLVIPVGIKCSTVSWGECE
jgi:DNA polymerase I-like protein with 3'-5' exonuclease and polymerase domains/uracil-DNA glycosylase